MTHQSQNTIRSYAALLWLGMLFDIFPLQLLGSSIVRLHLLLMLPFLSRSLRRETGVELSLFLRRGAAGKSPVYNPFFSDLDIGIILDDPVHAARVASAYHGLKKRLIFLGELEIYTKSEYEALSQLKVMYGALYELIRNGRKLFWLRESTRRGRQSRQSRYHRYKARRAMRQILEKTGISRPNHGYEKQIAALWQATRSEFEIRIPRFQGTADFFCPYLSRRFRLSESAAGISDTLLLLSCTPVSSRGNAQVDSLVREIRRTQPGIEAVYVALNEMERIFMSAFKRGASTTESWHSAWLSALTEGRPPVASAPFCKDPSSKVRVTSEGDVFFCCYQRTHPIGNLLLNSFESVWNSQLAKEIRFATACGFMHKTCQKGGCPHAYHPRTRVEQKSDQPMWPEFLDIDPPNSHCNIGGNRPNEHNPACIMCERSLPGYRFEADYAAQVLPKLVSLMPHVRYLHIQGVAEAFWKGLIFDYLDRLEFHKYKNDIAVGTYSNGIAFDPIKQVKWLETTQNSTITFSIDAATGETYRKIRRLPAFDRVQENIRNYATLVRQYAGNHIFRITHNINTINVGEVGQMVELGARLGATEIAFDVTGGRPREIVLTRENEHLFIQAEAEIRDAAERLNQKIVWVRPFRWAGS